VSVLVHSECSTIDPTDIWSHAIFDRDGQFIPSVFAWLDNWSHVILERVYNWSHLSLTDVVKGRILLFKYHYYVNNSIYNHYMQTVIIRH